MYRNMKWKILLIIVIVGLAFWSQYPLSEKINLGLDLKGGMHLVLKVDTSKIPEGAKQNATNRAVQVLRNRIDEFGVREPLIQKQGSDKIVIQLPGIEDRNRALNIIGKTAQLEFKLVEDDPELVKQALEDSIPEGYELKAHKDGKLLLEKDPVLTGDAIEDAITSFSSQMGIPYISLTFNSEGAKKFARITEKNVGERLAIVLDEKVQSAPTIREKIPSGKAQITGRFSVEEARDLSITLRAGALPAPIDIIEERTVGPTLGEDSVRKGIRSIIIGGILVLSFLALYYLLAGIIANFALCLNIIIIMGALAYFDATLTLPGMAGILLTIGMAVDANVLIFERIREELKLGKPLRPAIGAGYDKVFLTIFDANITTLIIALMLFQFGTGPIRGFATTLSIGILSSMFTALVITRLVFDILTKTISRFKKLPMLQIISESKIRFLDLRKIMFSLSVILIIVGMVVFGIKGEKNFGVDFSGGSIQEFEFKNSININNIRDILKGIGFGDSVIQQVKDTNRVIIRSYKGATDKIEMALKQAFEDVRVLRIEKVGPIIGNVLRRKALLAVIYSLIGISLYIFFRFKHLKFATGAIIALFHDVLICLGALSFSGRELSLPVIAALLTIVGYSINDTIVVYSRIRENLKVKKDELKKVINSSINQVLSRTLLTSLTTLLVVISLYFFGGEVINDFAFVLLVGIIAGTYSSIFIAAPCLVYGKNKNLS